MKTDVDNMRSDIEYLKQPRPSSSSIKQTEYLKAIGFMKNETEKYRDFVQQQFIMAAFITVWGLNSRKDISNIIQNEYKTQINNEIAHIIGGQGWLPLAVFPSPTQCDLSYNAKKDR